MNQKQLFRRKLRKIWHDLYYVTTYSFGGARFAKTCKEVISEIDAPTPKQSLIQRVRHHLHLSVCQTCHNYSEVSTGLKAAVQKYMAQKIEAARSEKWYQSLNEKLIERFKKSS